MTRGWWRRNAFALVVLAVLGPATAALISYNSWTRWSLANPATPTTVAPGESIVFHGSEIGDAKAHFEDGVEGTPNGARVVAVTIEIDSRGTELSCGYPTMREVGGTQREWNAATFTLHRPFDPDRVTLCDSSQVGPYTLSADFIVPDAATGPFAVEIVPSSKLPDFIRLIVEP